MHRLECIGFRVIHSKSLYSPSTSHFFHSPVPLEYCCPVDPFYVYRCWWLNNFERVKFIQSFPVYTLERFKMGYFNNKRQEFFHCLLTTRPSSQ